MSLMLAVTGVAAESGVSDLVIEFQRIGATMVNPNTRAVMGFSSDGDVLRISAASTLAQIMNQCSGMQLWFEDSMDIYVSWEAKDEIHVILENLEEELMRAILGAVGDCCRRWACGEASVRLEFSVY